MAFQAWAKAWSDGSITDLENGQRPGVARMRKGLKVCGKACRSVPFPYGCPQ